ncbi:patatin-like phospholipase family protein [Bowmanella sp. JS7-9]|uniref:Patatin-like phospholipase family protein n=1 Tax=Pseudobowmanella zhangzhouensis TaxID=1537679 RepID=A0ABW1XHC6_9ALTE
MNNPRNDTALMLSGGGARAAYQVGVLKAITQFLPRNHNIPFPIICGTSAGAINATAMACYASCYHLGVRKLEHVWKHMLPEHIFETRFGSVLRHLIKNYLKIFRSDDIEHFPSSILNNEPLRRLLHKTLDFPRLERNLAQGHLRAVCVNASSYANHDSLTFFQSGEDIEPWQRVKRRGLACRLNVEHLMASAAIPMLFPSIKLGNEYFGDGSIHQLSPLSAPIHLGANKVMVIGMEQPILPLISHPKAPSLSAVAGHLLDTVFEDTLSADLERLERINHLITLMDAKKRSQSHLRPIQTLVLNPTIDLNHLASENYHLLPAGLRSMLNILGIRADAESSLPSYLLFDHRYCSALIQYGFNDTMQREDEIRQFLEL